MRSKDGAHVLPILAADLKQTFGKSPTSPEEKGGCKKQW